jgi:hypothetical protein
MSRITRIVPTIVLTVAALALVSPAAQARPIQFQTGDTAGSVSGGPNDVSPIVQSIHAANAEKHARGVVVTTGDKPLANPVQLPHDLKVSTTAVATPDSSGNGFDWTAAAVGAGLGGILMLMLGAGMNVRRRGQLA